MKKKVLKMSLTQPFFLLDLLSAAVYVLNFPQYSCGWNVKMCENKTDINITETLLFTNNNFPGFSKVNGQCSCTMTTQNGTLSLYPAYIDIKSHLEEVITPMILSVDNKRTFPVYDENLRNLSDIFSVKNSRATKFSFKVTQEDNTTSITFAFVIGLKDRHSSVAVSCFSSSINQNISIDMGGDDVTKNLLEMLSTPTFVTLLLGVCVLLLIILTVESVVLCSSKKHNRRSSVPVYL